MNRILSRHHLLRALVAIVALAFPLKMRGLGIWLGLASGLAFVAVVLVIRWMRREQLGLTPHPA